MLTRLGDAVRRACARHTPFTDVVGLARSLLAVAVLSTLLLNRVDTLFRPVYSLGEAPFCVDRLQRMSLFCLVGPRHLMLAKWVAIALLLLAASGWRPRLTGIPQWWVSHSFFITAACVDGGDQATAVLSLLLIPICLADPRRWHWDEPPPPPATAFAVIATMVAWIALVLARVQVAGIYLHAAVGKMFVYEWQDGTALYYWLQHPYFGLARWLRPAVVPLLVNRYTEAALTWGVVALELFLTMGLVATRSVRRVLLPLGVALHLGILICHGLASFALVMWAGLILLLRPTDLTFEWPRPWLASWPRRLGGWRARTPQVREASHERPAAAAIPR